MRARFIYGALLVGLLSTGACTQMKNGEKKAAEGTEIEKLPMSIDILNAKNNYKVTDSVLRSECYMTVSTTVQWPVSIGDFDIKPLQDTIIAMAFPDSKSKEIDKAIKDYVDDIASYELGSKAVRIDTVPTVSAFNNIYYNTVNLTLAEISDETVTYNLMFNQYMGGAHPQWGSMPFSYDFATKSVIDNKWLFKPDSSDKLAAIISETIAGNLDLKPEELNRILLVDKIPVSECVYIENGEIVFHYNPYAILPYSFGEVNASISPYSVEWLLTDQARKLLL